MIFLFDEIRERMKPLFEDEGLKLVLLFGSAASGRTHKQTDIDLAFLYDKPVDILLLTNRIISIRRSDTIDVVDLRRASPLLKFAIARDCVTLYENGEGFFNEFYSLAFRMYVDTKKLRDAHATVINHFLRSRGLA
jgi:uncharacterized protein